MDVAVNSSWDETTLSLLGSRNVQANSSSKEFDWNNIQRVKPEEIIEQSLNQKRVNEGSFSFQKHL